MKTLHLSSPRGLAPRPHRLMGLLGRALADGPALAFYVGLAACSVNTRGLENGPSHTPTTDIQRPGTGGAGAGAGVGGSGGLPAPGDRPVGSGGGGGESPGTGPAQPVDGSGGGRARPDSGGAGGVSTTGGQGSPAGGAGIGGTGSPGSGGGPGLGGSFGSGGGPGAGGGVAGGGTVATVAEVVAFPGAVGVGRLATGGRRTTVVHVTTLADSGPGSFRDAVGTPNRFVVFDVGGYVNLATPVRVASNLTIAGQTAPGDGVGIMGREVTFDGASNVIVRYLRFRQGDLDPDTGASSVNLSNAALVILDHVSIEFGRFHDLLAVGASKITVQRSLLADPLDEQLVVWADTGPYTFYGDLFANFHNHGPRALAETQFVDNVIYNYQAAYTTGNDAEVHNHDLVHNSFIAGPSTTRTSNWFYQVRSQAFYLDGNSGDSSLDGKLNGTVVTVPGGAATLTVAWSPATAALPTVSAADAYARALATAGASLHRDQVDALVIADVTSLGTSGGLFNSQTATGLPNQGYGTLAGGTAPVDTDRDGMPDAWETKVGLDPNDPADANADPDGNGYTRIEEYVNGLADGV